MRRLFGTDGIRGKANVYPMDADTAFKVGVVSAHLSKDRTSSPVIIIGRDTRLSGSMLESALAAGICAAGGEALIVGEIPTPGVAYLTRSTDAEAGVVISASHNPFVDNGIKLFNRNGFKLPDELELKIEEHMLDGDIREYFVEPHEVGRVRYWPEGSAVYKANLGSVLEGRSLDGLKIAIDCAHGAAYKIAPALFASLGAQVTAIGIEPDGRNINKGCGSLHIDGLSRTVSENGLDLGVAFDGDADRALFVDSSGELVDGDQVMAACAARLKAKGKLTGNTLVATQMSNIGLEHACRDMSVKLVRTDVGDRYVVEEMQKNGYSFGGEQSGHMIFLDHSTTGDGMLAALWLLDAMRSEGRPLHELARVMTRVPQVLKNLMVSYKVPLENLPRYQEISRRIIDRLGSEGRILVRYSGTENKVRVMIEGHDPQLIEEYADSIIHTLDEELN